MTAFVDVKCLSSGRTVRFSIPVNRESYIIECIRWDIYDNFSEVPSSAKTSDIQIIAYNGRNDVIPNISAVENARRIEFRV